jgi:hypothetical protein
MSISRLVIVAIALILCVVGLGLLLSAVGVGLIGVGLQPPVLGIIVGLVFLAIGLYLLKGGTITL